MALTRQSALSSEKVFGSESVNEQSSGSLGLGLGLGVGVTGILVLSVVALLILARRQKDTGHPPMEEMPTDEKSSWGDERPELMSNEKILAADEPVEDLAVFRFHGEE
jgi:hypothetical protein